jgi:acyl transferase domain-containing protein
MTASGGGAHRPGLDVAIVGLAGRFPGAGNVEAFWRNLCAGVESVATLRDDELLAAGVDPAVFGRPDYVRARAVLDGIDLFDAEFFGFTPREAAALDPQHRFFLECAWEAFENAGYDPERAGGRVGVYAGSSLNGYHYHARSSRARLQSAADISALLSLDKDFLTTRVSYKLNLEGPSIAVQTACSTSLVAVHLACQALLNGECDLALAGGVAINVPQQVGYLYQPGAIGSPDGHCRAFDAKAQGTVGGSGVGVVLLKRLDDALADGDSIVAVIKGSAVNNDGRKKVGYTAPRVEGQARAIGDAHAAAEIEADSIGYVEAHGTGTPLGDPVEVAALTQAFRAGTDRKGFCALGSVKTNVGHLDAAAGVAGLIKAALAVARAAIPPSLHFTASNADIDFDNSPFFVAKELTAWPASASPRRAGVSSFGMGGTNAHIVLEEAPALPATGPRRPCELLVISARSRESLEASTDALAARLEAGDVDLADLAYTLQLGRRPFAHRRAVACRTPHGAAEALRARGGRVRSGVAEGGARKVAFLFPGQGSQHPNMARELYETEPAFRAEVDACAKQLEPALGLDLRAAVFSAADGADKSLARTSLTQPALFVIEYALARLLMSWGLTPDAMLGHSVGEYVAACLAGCMSLDDALALVAARGRLMEATEDGAMLAVSAHEEEVRGWLGGELDLAAINARRQCVVSGPVGAIERLGRELEGRGVRARRLLVSRAFHSRLMNNALSAFREVIARVPLRAPHLRWVSNLTGTWVTPAEATSPDYWVRHLRETVRFADGVATLGAQPGLILLEVGPGRALSRLCQQAMGEVGRAESPGRALALSTLPEAGEPEGASEALFDAIGQLWAAGTPVAFAGLQEGWRRRRVPLPATPFEHKRYWLDPIVPDEKTAPEAKAVLEANATLGASGAGAAPGTPAVFEAGAAAVAQAAFEAGATHEAGATPGPAGMTSAREAARVDVGEWFYVPSWKRAPLRALAPEGEKAHWLLLASKDTVALGLAERLEGAGHRVTRVGAGDRFERLAGDAFTIRPERPEDYQALARALGEGAPGPTRVVHALGLGEARGEALDAAGFRQEQGRGALSVLWTARMLGQGTVPARLLVLANGLHDLTGREALRPEQAPLLGVCRSVSREYRHVTCRLLDLEAHDVAPCEVAWLVDRVVAEAAQADADAPVVAYRGRHRWEPSVEPLALGAPPGRPLLLRERGVYLITGGLGGVGLWAADYLARQARARLLLTARSAPTEAQREKIAALEALGAEVLVARADVTDREAMRLAVIGAVGRFGALHGIVHAAGVASGGLVERLTGEAFEAELAPKALGTLVLRDIARDVWPDFLLLCSSVTALSGGVARAGYSAANAYLDAFAQAAARGDEPYTVSVNFDRWRQVGMAARAEARLAALGLRDVMADGMTPEQGQQVFHRIFGQSSLPQVIVSTRPLRGLPSDDEGAALAGRLGLGQREGSSAEGGGEGRPGAAGEPMTAEALTSQIEAIWAKAFGLGPIDAGQDFFALGGESLLALQILNRIRESVGVELSLRDFFERPTVEGLVERVRAARAQGGENAGPALVALPRRAKRLPPAEGAGAPAKGGPKKAPRGDE